jgi:hypothetical protein
MVARSAASSWLSIVDSDTPGRCSTVSSAGSPVKYTRAPTAEVDEDAEADAGQLGAAAQERISQQQDGEDGPDHRQMVKQQV